MTTPVIPLASGFEPASSADWLALVAKTLKGAGAETLVSRTADGLEVRPLYGPGEETKSLPFTPALRNGAAGWDIRASVVAASPSVANGQALDALAGGAASVLVKTSWNAGPGVSIASTDDLARVLEGVMTDVAPIALDGGFHGLVLAEGLGKIAKAAPAAPLALHMDPLSAFATLGASPGPVASHITSAATVGAKLSETYPKATLFLASGVAVHEAGGSPAWELGFALASALAYAKALTAAGMAMESAFGGIVLGLTAEAQPLATIAKLRAARVLWRRMTDACGAEVAPRIEARSSGRMLTRADRWTNLIRLTSAGFGAAVGGADALVLGTFTDAIGAPDASALRMARNTQLVLMEEAHVGRVSDPAGGSWAVDSMTNDLARAAWAAFVEIEAAGGAASALRRGTIAAAVEKSRAALVQAIAEKTLRIIGVTDFKGGDAAPEAAPPVSANLPPPPRAEGADETCPPLTAIRLEDLAQ